MSRTDRHDPYWVKLADPYEQRFYWFDQGTPRHGWRKVFWFRDCNCRMYGCCGGWRKAETRQRRHDEQRRSQAVRSGDLTVWERR